jgi:hypothetical protein
MAEVNPVYARDLPDGGSLQNEDLLVFVKHTTQKYSKIAVSWLLNFISTGISNLLVTPLQNIAAAIADAVAAKDNANAAAEQAAANVSAFISNANTTINTAAGNANAATATATQAAADADAARQQMLQEVADAVVNGVMGPQGPQGEQGPQGPAGVSPSVSDAEITIIIGGRPLSFTLNGGAATLDFGNVPNTGPHADSITTDQTLVAMGPAGGVVVVNVSASWRWQVAFKPAWLGASTTADTLILTFPLNYSSTTDRYGAVLLTCGAASAEITLQQSSDPQSPPPPPNTDTDAPDTNTPDAMLAGDEGVALGDVPLRQPNPDIDIDW